MRLHAWLLALVAVLPFSAAAEAPGTLSEWRAIVRSDLQRPACVQQGDAWLCAWPGQLQLQTSPGGGTFAQEWEIQKAGPVALPGDPENWPQDVRVDGRAAPVLNRSGAPEVRLPVGRHRITGSWTWDEAPTRLRVPASLGWWQWQDAGKNVLAKLEDGQLIREQSLAPVKAGAGTLQMRVFRKWVDGQILTVETRLELRVSGPPREEVIGPLVDPARLAVLQVVSGWPSMLEKDGRLRIQVSPGSHTVTLVHRCIKDCSKPFAALTAGPEYWALQQDPAFRTVAWDASTPIDPQQMGAPGEWRALPWIAVTKGARAGWSVKARGPDEAASNLTLHRQVWPALTGGGWVLEDTLSGTIAYPRGFAVRAPLVLEAARSGDRYFPVTLQPASGAVQWYQSDVNLQAAARLDNVAMVQPATGWNVDFQKVDWSIHLPPGVAVLHAAGPESVSGTWISRWTILGVFWVMLILILAWRVGKLPLTIPVGVLLLVSFHAPGFPYILLTLGLALTLAVRAVSGTGTLARLLSMFRMGVLVLLTISTAFFVVQQFRAAVYPEWKSPIMAFGGAGLQFRSAPSDYAAAESAASPAANGGSIDGHAYGRIGDDGPSAAELGRPMPVLAEDSAMNKMQAVASPPPPPPARVIEEKGISIAAGQATPRWPRQWDTVQLSWQGKVSAKDTVRLWMVPAILVRLAHALSALLLALVLLRLALPGLPDGPWKARLPRRLAPLLGALLLLPTLAFAQQPSVTIAEEAQSSAPSVGAPWWYQKLREQEAGAVPECVADCVALATVTPTRSGKLITLTLEAHAQSRAPFPLPHGDDATRLVSVRVDGSDRAFVLGAPVRWILLEPGVHTVVVQLEAPAEAGALSFPIRPGQVDLKGVGPWSGVTRGHLTGDTLGWQDAQVSKGAPGEKKVSTEILPYVLVDRVLSLQNEWTMTTRVTRQAPASGAFVVKVPLLKGEQVQGDLPVKDGAVEAAFAAGASQVEWSSVLKKETRLQLSPIDASVGTERWQVAASSRYRLSASGLPPRADNAWSFWPLPGESLALEVAQPEVRKGSVVMIDAATLGQQISDRGREVVLELSVRATATGEVEVSVPAGWELQSVSQQGQPPAPLRVQGAKLLLPVLPGQSTWAMKWAYVGPPTVRITPPAFAFSVPAANITTTHELLASRWVLGVSGDGLHPAVLYWPYLAAALLLGMLLSRLPLSPLPAWQWMLLALGLVGESMACAISLALWLFAMRAAAMLPPARRHVVIQIVLLLWGLIALLTLIGVVLAGMLGTPDMHLLGMNGQLQWYVDVLAAGKQWPAATLVSVPKWIYQGLMLAWALWVVHAAVGWVRSAVLPLIRDGAWVSPKRAPPATPPPAE